MPEEPSGSEPEVPRPRSFGPGEKLLRPDGEHRGRYGPYVADRGLCNAANTAYLLGRPLLLTGEAGCGKTDFAWVVAHALGFRPEAATSELAEPEPLQCHVRSEMSARDLLYHYDALLRFVDSHHPQGEVRGRTGELSRYFELRGLGKALAWPHDERPVLLIDEIDKAPRDLPNDLLQALDVGQFEVAELHEGQSADLGGGFWLQRTMGGARPLERRPFVVITSNVEQQLPEPFLRRCVFFHIAFPSKERLLEIVRRRPPRDHQGRVQPLPEPLVGASVEVFLALRDVERLGKRPATSELLDWTEAMVRYWEPERVQRWMRAFAAGITITNKGKRVMKEKGESLRWRNLPGLECLLKLRDDRALVRAGG